MLSKKCFNNNFYENFITESAIKSCCLVIESKRLVYQGKVNVRNKNSDGIRCEKFTMTDIEVDDRDKNIYYTNFSYLLTYISSAARGKIEID